MRVATRRLELTTEDTAPHNPRSQVLPIAENVVRTRTIVGSGPGLQVTLQVGRIIVILDPLDLQDGLMQAQQRHSQEIDTVSRFLFRI